MAFTYTHTENLESPSGYTTTLSIDNITIESPSEVNNDSTLNTSASENKVLKIYHEQFGSIKAQIDVTREVNETNVLDKTYMGGSLAREDYAIGTTQGQAIIAKLQATWPNEVSSFTVAFLITSLPLKS